MSTLMTIVIILGSISLKLTYIVSNPFHQNVISSFRQKGDEKFMVNKEGATFQE